MGPRRQRKTAIQHESLVESRSGPAAENLGEDLQWIGLRRFAGAIARSEVGTVPLRLRGARTLHLEPRRGVVRRLLDPRTDGQGLRWDCREILLGERTGL